MSELNQQGTEKNYYPGIFKTWGQCHKQTIKLPGALFEGFATLEEAVEFLCGKRCHSGI